MTIKEAIIKSLDDLVKPSTYLEIYRHIMDKNYYPPFKDKNTPEVTVSAQLGNFIRRADARVKRVKFKDGIYRYYLAKNESLIKDEELIGKPEQPPTKEKKSYNERDLHPLLVTYLKNYNIQAKTIFHEKSASRKDKNQKWVHPDMVGIEFLKLENKSSQSLQWTINRNDTFKLISYELKKEINTDYELKEAFFQTVSNSSWANHGFLAAFYINESLHDEIKRLSEAFGIGVIELKANPFESKQIFPSKYKELDFKTIDKLCEINKEFETFIKLTEKIMSADAKYREDAERGLQAFCDKPFKTDSEIIKYCKEKNIPLDNSYE